MSKPELQNEIEKAREMLELFKIIKETYSMLLEIADMQNKLMEKMGGALVAHAGSVVRAERAEWGRVTKLVLSVMTPGKEYTAKEIWNILKNTSVSVNLSSVYGALNRLCARGVVTKVRRGVYVRPK
jgi:hypothetical protein